MRDTLVIYDKFDQLQKAAIALMASGFFKDITSEAQAIVKVMAGAELGLPPFAAMSGIHIIQGKPVLGANVLATLVKNDTRYNYRVKQCDNDKCILEWFEDGKPQGESSFTIAEAKIAGLTGKDNWIKYPSDMLFARAISRGARRFAPGIFGGSPVYTPDEMNLDTDEDGHVIGGTLHDPEPPKRIELISDQPVTEPTPITYPEPSAPAPKLTNGDVYKAIVDAGLSENNHSARAALNLCKTGYDTVEKACAWMRMYRGWRDMGSDSKKAAEYANSGEMPR